MRLAFVVMVLSLCEAGKAMKMRLIGIVCRTYSSDCVSSTKRMLYPHNGHVEIQRLALYHDNTRWMRFVIEIIQYNSTDCETELYRVKYTSRWGVM